MKIAGFFAKLDGKMLNFKKAVWKTVTKRGREKKFLIRFGALLLCILSVFAFVMGVYRKAEPLAVGTLENVVGGWIEELVAEAVRDSLEENRYTWSDFCTKVVGNDGSVVSLSVSTENVGAICADVVKRINREASNRRFIKISLPLGSVVAPEYFSGKGPSVRVRAVPYISVSARVSSEMREAGINQTLHTISMTVVSDTRVICMSSSVTFRRESKVLLAESVIVGKIPIVS